MIRTTLIIFTLVLASCSDSDDSSKQLSCQELKSEIEVAQKAILDHQARGNGGNQSAWEAELERLTNIRNQKQNEYTQRHCL